MPGARGTDWDEDEDAQKLWDEKRDMLGLSDEEMQELMEDLKKEKAGGGREDSEDEEYDSELEEWEKKEKEAAEKSMMQKKAKKSKGEQGEKSKKATKKPTSAFALEEPTPSFASSSRSKSKSKPSSSTAASSSKLPSKAEDVHSEPLALSLADSSAKASARRSLRFHTAKIDSAAQRRSSARQGRMGGDEDIPYRNKQAGRDAALRKNGPKGAGDGGEDLDGMEFGEEDRRVAREVRGGKRGMDEEDGAAEEGDDGYYQLVKKRKRDVKEAKQEAYDEEQAATRFVFTFPSCPDAICSHILCRSSLPVLTHLHSPFRLNSLQRTRCVLHRRRLWPSIPYPGDSQEPRAHPAPIESGAKPACQEASAVREGQEAGVLAPGRLQGRSERAQGGLWGRGDGYQSGRQESQVCLEREKGMVTTSIDVNTALLKFRL
jgi:hypothetical protein